MLYICCATGASSSSNHYSGSGKLIIIDCIGYESTLSQCSYSIYDERYCNNAVNVSCSTASKSLLLFYLLSHAASNVMFAIVTVTIGLIESVA